MPASMGRAAILPCDLQGTGVLKHRLNVFGYHYDGRAAVLQ